MMISMSKPNNLFIIKIGFKFRLLLIFM